MKLPLCLKPHPGIAVTTPHRLQHPLALFPQQSRPQVRPDSQLVHHLICHLSFQQQCLPVTLRRSRLTPQLRRRPTVRHHFLPLCPQLCPQASHLRHQQSCLPNHLHQDQQLTQQTPRSRVLRRPQRRIHAFETAVAKIARDLKQLMDRCFSVDGTANLTSAKQDF